MKHTLPLIFNLLEYSKSALGNLKQSANISRFICKSEVDSGSDKCCSSF